MSTTLRPLLATATASLQPLLLRLEVLNVRRVSQALPWKDLLKGENGPRSLGRRLVLPNLYRDLLAPLLAVILQLARVVLAARAALALGSCHCCGRRGVLRRWGATGVQFLHRIFHLELDLLDNHLLAP